MYLDDLDPSELTEEQKEEFQKMFEEDPYHFYNLWRDPDAAQRYFEGDDFKTTPASEVYLKLGALKMAGAPEGVIDFWSQLLKNKGRPTEDNSDLPPKTKPIPEKLAQIDRLCRNINLYLNETVDNVTPDPNDFPDEVPIAFKWHQIMNRAMGSPAIEEHHDGVARHYPATDAAAAHMGVEILEVTVFGKKVSIDLGNFLDLDADTIDLNQTGEDIWPNGVDVERRSDRTILYFTYFNVYE